MTAPVEMLRDLQIVGRIPRRTGFSRSGATGCLMFDTFSVGFRGWHRQRSGYSKCSLPCHAGRDLRPYIA